MHFSYHKCLTVYYINVMREFSKLHDLKYRHFNSEKEKFIEELNRSELDVLSLNNKNINLESLGEYRGSHFVRDPRDLVISGYYYHQWCPESWCLNDEFYWKQITDDPLFKKYFPYVDQWPNGISYQDFIKTLGLEQGLVLEMIWRTGQFRNMAEWDYENPHMLEIKYEDLVGEEAAAFARIYDHYGLNPEWKSDWMALADRFSRKNKKLGEKVHARDGSNRQWERVFSPEIRQEFKERYGALLVKLGYEQDMAW